MFSSFHHMSDGYSDIILWAIFLFLSYFGYEAAVVSLLLKMILPIDIVSKFQNPLLSLSRNVKI